MKFTLTIPQAKVAQTREKVIDKLVAATTLKGFRKGKAPRQAVIDHLGKSKILEQSVNQILPGAYTQEVKKRQLKPITFPQFKPLKIDGDFDWEFEVEVVEKPEVKLNNYQQAIKGLFAKEKIWTPSQGDPSNSKQKSSPASSQPDPDDQKKKIDLLFNTLLKTCELEIPQMLVKDDVNRQLAALLDQVNKLGMSIDDYLKAKNHTQQSIRELYTQQAEQSLKLEFILLEISHDFNITVSDQGIDQLLKQSGSKTTPKHEEIDNLKVLLQRRKTIDRLLTLAA